MSQLNVRRVVLLGFSCVILSGLLLSSYVEATGLKKVVAVSRFENKSSYSGQWHLDNGMADQLTDALMKSGQFVVLERETLTDVLEEQDLAASGRAQKSKSARTGKLTSAQILIKGTITEFESQSSGSGAGIGIMGLRLGGKKEEAHVGLIIRLIDTTTGQVLNSKRVEGKAESSGVALGVDIAGVDFGTEAFTKTPLGKATQLTIDNAVEFIASKLRSLPFQGRVIKTVGGEVYISAGEQTGVSVGDTFTVYSVGEELVDPDTGELLGSEEAKIGTVKVYEVKDKYSKAKIISGKGCAKGNIIRSE